MDNSKELKSGIILSYIQMGLSVVIGLVYTPIMLRFLGQNEYGLYNVVASTISMLSILSLGFNSGYIRFFSERKKNNDYEAINRLNGLFLCVFTVIGFIALCCGLFLTNNLNLVFDKGLTENEYIIAKRLMLLLTINLTLSFPLSVFADIISANEKFVFIKLVGLINTVASPLTGFILLILGYKSIALATISLVLQIITGTLNLYYVLFKLNYRFAFRNFERRIFKELFSYTAFIALNIIIDQINWKIDCLLLGRFCGTSSVAVYSIGSTIHNYYLSFSISISGVFTPRIHRIAREYEDPTKKSIKFTEMFVKVGRIQFLILSLIASGFILFGKEFVYFWAGESYSNSYWVALILIIPVTIPLIQNLGIEIQRSINKHKFRSIVYSFMAIFNLIISIILCPKYGEIGVAIGTSVSIILANGFIMNLYYSKECGIDIIKFWKNILRMSIGLIIPVSLAYLIKKFIIFDTLKMLILGIFGYTIIYCGSVWLFSMNDSEKQIVRSFILKLRNKI
ncbi:MAG: oligosaccharide flippase family protein [Clostridia bacterium]|nr:oligosaccharide flippase family protein [Clostridia bacterium]